jgi:hypothetical protein
MFKEVWCMTSHWKRIFIGILLIHGAYNILYFDHYLNVWNAGITQTELFSGLRYYYFISYLPLMELVTGLLLIFKVKEKLLLGAIFYVLLFAGYYALDSDYLVNFFMYFGMAFFGLFVLSGQYVRKCGEDNPYKEIPTGGM